MASRKSPDVARQRPSPAQLQESKTPTKSDARTSQPALILLVEDDRLVRLTTAHLLEDLGYRVLSASEPNSALQKYDRCPESVDLVLTDVTMPGKSGADLIELLYERGCRAKVVYMSAYPRRVLISERGIDPEFPLLEKPLTQESLANKIAAVLRDPTTGLFDHRRRRRARRYSAGVPARWDLNGEDHRGTMQVVSLTGGFVASHTVHPIGTLVSLVLNPPGLPSLVLDAEVRCILEQGPGMGVQFSAPAMQARGLRHFISQVADEQLLLST